jgi:DNA invertase Pin-like site-specific DNA recombinase
MAKRKPRPSSPRVILYTRVSTDEQVESGLSLEAQRAELEAEAARRGWTDLEVIEDPGHSGATIDRPGLRRALELLEAGEAGVLMVAKLDRLTRTIAGFGQVMEAAERQGWAVVILELDGLGGQVDMTTPMGEFIAGLMALLARLERRMIAQRTRDAARAKRARGERTGREPEIPAKVRARIVRLRRAGETPGAIARRLTDERVPTMRGGKTWQRSTIQRVLASVALDQELEATRRSRAPKPL